MRAPAVVADPLVVLAAELIEVGCPDDGLRHLLDDQAHAEVLTACADGRVEVPTFEALCGGVLVADSLLAAPRPICPACAQIAAPRLSTARRHLACRHAPAPTRPRLVRTTWARVIAVVAACAPTRRPPAATFPLTHDRTEPA